ncbi:uncharacterized protein MYCFIDRAFT_174227 [Pseudocercospora fijiensis CIRAD86]|uniref:Uncharacterized protein n=1 Tax=Pseudocercospora fijiensis (strain CIRAD86) TaxID=383855 RepID=M2ZUI3_PSEFD|nr:uncharacterized protein MYCFIDRAFT_174227 [Pseudocercospora fijiensis CIRAD86]EME82664.1 hypothetical protein MYCFIDRAFT_174227 [Pseudocercospora fijiensis CIRAD86]
MDFRSKGKSYNASHSLNELVIARRYSLHRAVKIMVYYPDDLTIWVVLLRLRPWIRTRSDVIDLLSPHRLCQYLRSPVSFLHFPSLFRRSFLTLAKLRFSGAQRVSIETVHFRILLSILYADLSLPSAPVSTSPTETDGERSRLDIGSPCGRAVNLSSSAGMRQYVLIWNTQDSKIPFNLLENLLIPGSLCWKEDLAIRCNRLCTLRSLSKPGLFGPGCLQEQVPVHSSPDPSNTWTISFFSLERPAGRVAKPFNLGRQSHRPEAQSRSVILNQVLGIVAEQGNRATSIK